MVGATSNNYNRERSLHHVSIVTFNRLPKAVLVCLSVQKEKQQLHTRPGTFLPFALFPHCQSRDRSTADVAAVVEPHFVNARGERALCVSLKHPHKAGNKEKRRRTCANINMHTACCTTSYALKMGPEYRSSSVTPWIRRLREMEAWSFYVRR